MILSLKAYELAHYIRSQLEAFFPDGGPVDGINGQIDLALGRVEQCFSAIHTPYHLTPSGEVLFNHLNCDHYATLLYFLSNNLYKNGGETGLCTKLFYLNKMLHSLDVYYEVELPDIFCFAHPLGTVLGRAKYSNYLLVYQGCTVGAARDAGLEARREVPELGEYLAIYKGGAILGRSTVGRNCKIAAHSVLIDMNLPPDSIYIGEPKDYVVKDNQKGPDKTWG